MWAMIACCIALVIWTGVLSYLDHRHKKTIVELDEAGGSLSIVVDAKE